MRSGSNRSINCSAQEHNTVAIILETPRKTKYALRTNTKKYTQILMYKTLNK
jgi:hypothetical protein